MGRRSLLAIGRGERIVFNALMVAQKDVASRHPKLLFQVACLGR